MSDLSNDTPVEEDEGAGGGWIMTFADLMSLLMCFFVLLLSFSEIEQKKYKQVAGSMSKAFGVQREIPTKEIPKGTSIIAQEFSPGKPSPTIIQVIQQSTTDQHKANLDFSEFDVESEDKDKTDDSDYEGPIPQSVVEIAMMLAKALEDVIDEGLIEIEALPDRVSIRIRERGSFDSAQASLRPSFQPILSRISRVLNEIPGRVVVSGHTDNVPIATSKFPSNWELSAARAAAFVHFMSKQGQMDPLRMEIRAHGEMKPLAVNNSVDNRAKNRRVEIALVVPTSEVPQIRQRMDELMSRAEPAKASSGPL